MTKLEGMYAPGGHHEEYWKYFVIRMERKSVECYVEVDGQCYYLHVLITFCLEANGRADRERRLEADCQQTHYVDPCPTAC